MTTEEIKRYEHYSFLAQEAFIRRAAQVSHPFMLKGSYVTRQYFEDPSLRIPADLDWVYLDRFVDENEARSRLSEWVLQVTTLALEDGVVFRSFAENAFWRRIDYAMADDFPTVNTDIDCHVYGFPIDFSMDVSFHLPIPYPPVSLEYRPAEGDAFTVPFTAPLSLQVAWKIHQTLVRPRFKDLFDLVYLVKHPTFDETTRLQMFDALQQECHAQGIDATTIQKFLSYQIQDLFLPTDVHKAWSMWRDISRTGFDQAVSLIAQTQVLPITFKDFHQILVSALQKAGITEQLMPFKPVSNRTHSSTNEPAGIVNEPRQRSTIMSFIRTLRSKFRI